MGNLIFYKYKTLIKRKERKDEWSKYKSALPFIFHIQFNLYFFIAIYFVFYPFFYFFLQFHS